MEDVDSFGELELIEAEEAFYRLAAYTNRRRRALQFRENGSHNLARQMDAACMGIFEKLPDWARWEPPEGEHEHRNT